MPGLQSRMASMMARPVMRVASRRIAISRGLFVPRSSSRIGSRFAISERGEAALSFAMNASSRDSRPSHGSFFVLRARANGSEAEALPSTSGRCGV